MRHFESTLDEWKVSKCSQIDRCCNETNTDVLLIIYKVAYCCWKIKQLINIDL